MRKIARDVTTPQMTPEPMGRAEVGLRLAFKTSSLEKIAVGEVLQPAEVVSSIYR